MEDEELKYGMRCRFLREEIAGLEAGGKVIRTLVRSDGLKHRNVTCAFVIHRDTDAELAYNGTMVVRCFGVCCENSLTARVRLKLLVGSEPIRALPWQEGIVVREDSPTVRFPGLLRLGDFESATAGGQDDSSLLEIRLLFDITAASPSFLVAPRVPAFQWTSLCDEEREMAVVTCSDGSLCAERTLLMRESPRWKTRLSDPADQAAPTIDCGEFTVTDVKVFLFYLQTQQFYDLARFDTFHTMARIAVRHSVSAVIRRCATFVNECVLLAEAGGRKPAEAATGAGAASAPQPSESPVSSKVRWTPEDLIAIWCTTVSHLGEESLGKALMRLIAQSSYTDIAKLSTFQQLEAATKSVFYHQFLLCREGAATAGQPRAAGPGGGGRAS